MAVLFKMVVLALSLTLGTCSLLRERRFLLDTKDDAKSYGQHGDVTGAFSWDLGDGNYSVDAAQKDDVLKALSDIRDTATELGKDSFMMEDYSNEYRGTLYTLTLTGDANLDKWRAASDALIDIFDATETLLHLNDHYVTELSDLIRMNKTTDQKQLFDDALDNTGKAINRVDNILPKSLDVLVELRNAVTVGTNIDEILLMLVDVGYWTRSMKGNFENLIEAAGIKSDKLITLSFNFLRK